MAGYLENLYSGLEIEGPDDDIARFIAHVSDGECAFSLDKILPVPEEVKHIAGPTPISEVAYEQSIQSLKARNNGELPNDYLIHLSYSRHRQHFMQYGSVISAGTWKKDNYGLDGPLSNLGKWQVEPREAFLTFSAGHSALHPLIRVVLSPLFPTLKMTKLCFYNGRYARIYTSVYSQDGAPLYDEVDFGRGHVQYAPTLAKLQVPATPKKKEEEETSADDGAPKDRPMFADPPSLLAIPWTVGSHVPLPDDNADTVK